MKKMNKKFVIISIAVALLVVATITASSYAYFTISNKTGEETVIKSGSMTLKLTDGNQITANSMLPGQSIEKEFSVENTGNVDTSYDVYLSEVINTFADKTDLVYELVSEDGGYNTIEPVQAPNVATKIVNQKSIGVNDTHHYTLKITFLNKNISQDVNQGKEFKATIQVNEYKDLEATVNYYLNNVIESNIPLNDGDNEYVYSSCDKNASITFDSINWTYEVNNLSQKNTTCNIYFESNKLDSITITNNPTKMNYSTTGETIDLSDMVVTATYEDNTQKILNSNDYTTSGSLTLIGNNDIVISYTDKNVTRTTTLTLTVEPIRLTNDSSNTFGPNSYNGDLTNYENTQDSRSVGGNGQFLKLPSNVSGKKINFVNLLVSRESYFTIRFWNASKNVIGSGYTYCAPWLCQANSWNVGNDIYGGKIIAIINENTVNTISLTIPENSSYISFVNFEDPYGASIYDIYITD